MKEIPVGIFRLGFKFVRLYAVCGTTNGSVEFHPEFANVWETL
jgi:hypothetical protein